MRVLFKVQIPVEAGNEALKAGTMGKSIQDFAEKAKPEAMYFTVADGWRTMYAVVDMASSSDMVRFGERFFMEMDASLEMTPCMNIDDLMAGLHAAGLS
jgi:hypothetical protein